MNNRNPLSGKNCTGFRFLFNVWPISRIPLYLPIEMKSLPQIQQLLNGASPLAVFNCHSIEYARIAFRELRKKYDFDYWAANEYFIKDIKDPDSIIPLCLNDCQHHVIDIIRKRYFLREIGRYVISKSFRRCGLTTVIQAYILWMQTYQRSNNSYTCGPSEIGILPLKTNLCRYLHRDIIPSNMGIYLPRVDWCAYFNTFSNPNAIRGINLGFVHFADMSRWKDSHNKNTSRAFMAAVSAVLLEHFTLVILEGDIPKSSSFCIKKNLRQDKWKNESQRLQCLSHYVNNPFFFNEVCHSQSTSAPHFHHIHLSQNLQSLPLPA